MNKTRGILPKGRVRRVQSFFLHISKGSTSMRIREHCRGFRYYVTTRILGHFPIPIRMCSMKEEPSSVRGVFECKTYERRHIHPYISLLLSIRKVGQRFEGFVKVSSLEKKQNIRPVHFPTIFLLCIFQRVLFYSLE